MMILIIPISIIAISCASVIYIWCIKPHKSLKEGLKDWVKESEGDL